MVATTRRKVITEYRLDTVGAADALKKLQITANRSARSLSRIDRSTKTTAKSMGILQRQAQLLSRAMQGFVAVDIAQRFTAFADSALDTSARLKSVSESAYEAGETFDDLLVIANKAGVSIQEISSSFTKFKIAVEGTGTTTDEVIYSLDTLATTLATTGASTQQVNAVMLQMSQSLGAGALMGDEYKSTVENVPVILEAWRKAMGKADVAMKDLSKTGQYSRESWFELNEEIRRNVIEMTGMEKPVQTIARAINEVTNNLAASVIEFEDSTGVFSTLAETILFVARNWDTLAVAALGSFVALSKFTGPSGVVSALVVGLFKLKDAAYALTLAFKKLVPVAVIATLYELYRTIDEMVDKNRELRETIESVTPVLAHSNALMGAIEGSTNIKALKDLKQQYIEAGDALREKIGVMRDHIAAGGESEDANGEMQRTLKDLEAQLAAVTGVTEATAQQLRKLGQDTLDSAKKITAGIRLMAAASSSAADAQAKLLAFRSGGAAGLAKSEQDIKYRNSVVEVITESTKKGEQLTSQIIDQAHATAQLRAEEDKHISSLEKEVALANKLTSGGGGGGGRRSSGGGARSSARSTQDALREQERLRESYIGVLEAADPMLRVTNEYIETIDTLSEALAKGAITQDEFSKGAVVALELQEKELEKLNKSAEDANTAYKDFADTVLGDAANALKAFATGAETGIDSVKRLITSISDAIFEMLVLAPLIAGIESMIGGKGFAAGLIGAFQPRALGGPVAAGTPYVVGERGPELFVPSMSGHIEPTVQAPQISVEVNTLPGTSANVTQNEGGLTIDIVEMHVAASLAAGGNVISRAAEAAYPGLRRGSV